ncbi:MAG: Gfo/Idh/MocA family oxidoreductase [Kyrpidia sp.]|nr:Gfo/Idh/MocA family oxidoreductase [Kyrpidia sp.]
MVSFGLIGPGAFGRFVLTSVAALPELQLKWVWGRRPESAECAAALWADARRGAGRAEVPVQCVAGEDVDWPRERVDVVVVATPPDRQPDFALRAIERGTALFLEKPGALDAALLDRVAARARARGVPATVDFVMRHNPLVRMLRAWVRQGVMGLPEHVQMENWAGGHMAPGHWFWDSRRSGGILVEHGIHFFDMVRYILDGEWVPVHAAIWETVRSEGWTAEDRVLAVVEHRGLDPETGKPVWRAPGGYYHGFTRPGDGERTQTGLVFSGGYAVLYGWIPERLEVWLDRGDAELQVPACASNEVRPTVERRGRRWTISFPDRQQLYRAAIRGGMTDLLAALRDPGHRVEAPLEDAVKALELAASLTRLARARHTVA